MKKATLWLLILLATTASLFPFDTTDVLITRLKVGYHPTEIYSISGEEFIILCAGIDWNHNNQMDEGDEPPSLWYMYSDNNQYTNTMSEKQYTFTYPVKVVDLDFRDQPLPFRAYMSPFNTRAILLNENDGFYEYQIASPNQDKDTVKYTKTKIFDFNVQHFNINNTYNLAVRDTLNHQGYLIRYNPQTKTFIDTIAAQKNIFSSLSFNHNNNTYFYILNSGENDSTHVMIYVLSEQLGINEPKFLKTIPIPDKSHTMWYDNAQTYVLSFDKITRISSPYFYVENYDLKEIGVDSVSFFSKDDNNNNSNLHYFSSYDGNLYGFEKYNYNLILDTIKALGKAEGYIMFNNMIILIATPYTLDHKDDNHVTLYKHATLHSISDLIKKDNLVSPNPVDEILLINLEEEVEYTIYTLNSQLVLQGKGLKIDVSKLPAGAYFIITKKNFSTFIKR